MIHIDTIIFDIQKSKGGISIYFEELLKRLENKKIIHYKNASPYGKINRYRNVNIKECAILHSSYYRIPTKKNIINITSVHDFTYEKFIHGPKRWLHSWQKFRAIRRSDAIICISENTKRDLLHYLPDVDPAKITVIYNGVSDLFFPIPDLEPAEKPYVLFVGARGGYKNFKAAAEAVALLPDIELCAVGGGCFSDEETAWLERLLPGRYRHAGMVSTEALNLLYNQAVALLYPSSYEGFGIPVVEAMRAGCPVIAVNASSIPEVAGEAGLLLESADPHLLRAALEQVLDEHQRAQLIMKGLEQSKHFSWDTTFEQTLAVYEKVLGRPLPRYE